jgi:hypothetical protein
VSLLVVVLLLLGCGGLARADDAPHPKVEADPHGLAVLGLGGALEAAWPLARTVYGEASLRPATLDEAHARVLVGEPAGEGAPAELRDLGDLRAAIHGDDGASRQLLQSIATSLHVKGIVVVEPRTGPGTRPQARVYVTASQAYDAVRYEPDPSAPVTWGGGASAVTWNGAVQALKRSFSDNPQPPPPAPSPTVAAVALHPVPPAPAADRAKSTRAFYQSPWFWAAAGAAAFAAGAVYLATRNDSTNDNIQLQVQVPK